MFVGSALLEDLEVPSRLLRLAVTVFVNAPHRRFSDTNFLRHNTLAIGEDGALRIWDAECKLRRINFSRRLVALDVYDNIFLVGLAPHTICIGRVDSSMHEYVELPDIAESIHIVRFVDCTGGCLKFVVCAGFTVFLLRVYQNGEVHVTCSRPFGEYPVSVIRAVDHNGDKILLASTPIRGRLAIAHAGFLRGMEPWTQLVTWKGYAAHVHGVVNVLDIDSKGKVLLECDDCALAVVDGTSGRTFCHDLVCGGTGSLPGGIGCLFNHGDTTLVFWSSANLPELAVGHIARREALTIWKGASETLGSPLFPHIASTAGVLGYIWSDAANAQHAIVLQDYDPSDGQTTR
jgi:hypothetical protein